MDGIANQVVAEFDLAVNARLHAGEGDQPQVKSQLQQKVEIDKEKQRENDVFLKRPHSNMWDKRTEARARERGAEAQLDLLRQYGVRDSLGRESNHADPTHAPYGEVAYRLRLMVKVIQDAKERKFMIIERLLFEYIGCIAALYKIGNHYQKDEDIAQSVIHTLYRSFCHNFRVVSLSSLFFILWCLFVSTFYYYYLFF
jgi:hypothetical protein